MDRVEELMTRGVANIIPNIEELKTVLGSGKKLNVYLGIDPTATKLHLGNAVVLRKLNEFAKLGHNVTFLIGDFTALVGDTSDKDSQRPILTSVEIEKNFKTYKQQAEKILDFSKVKIRHNSEWLNKLSFSEIIKLLQQFSFGDFGSRELIRKRLDDGKHVGMHEGLYPAIQGYDSYFLDTDIQIGGTDQTFNMQAGRTLQKSWRDKESFVLATEFLMGTDGRKMSKSWGNAIWLDEDVKETFGKIMTIGDHLIIQYYTLATNAPLKEIEEIEKKLSLNKDPMEIKKDLAQRILTELYSSSIAIETREDFERVVQNREYPKDMPRLSSYHHIKPEEKEMNVCELLIKAKLASSKSEAKRLIEQGGVYKDKERITDPNQRISLVNEAIIQVGKRKFVSIKKF